jgi:hypothetical protein
MMKTADKYIDRQYHFKGKWDIPSICGIKVVEKNDQTIVIATNLYETNPGTSISRWSAQLATTVCNDFNIDPVKLVFIERNPDRKSKLDFYKETFDIVEFIRVNDHFTAPVWKRIRREEVDLLLT